VGGWEGGAVPLCFQGLCFQGLARLQCHNAKQAPSKHAVARAPPTRRHTRPRRIRARTNGKKRKGKEAV